MRRADRLFQIVQILRSGRLTTAARLAEQLEVSERTVYRDIADLQGSGVPIDGEAGMGYLMRDGYDLPPVMFNRAEMEALVIGARMVGAWGGARMALASQTALSKIETVLPDSMRGKADKSAVYALDYHMPPTARQMLDTCNDAIETQSVLSIRYEDLSGAPSDRAIEPLGLYFWGKVWTLVAWCRLRKDFRSFRVDRVREATKNEEHFKTTPQQSLRAYLERHSHE